MEQTMDAANAPRTPNEGLTTFLVLLGLFGIVHFFLPSYVEKAAQGGEAVGEMANGFFSDDEIRFTITEDVFGSWSDEEEAFDIKKLSSLGYSGDLAAQIKLTRYFAENGDEKRAFSWSFRAAMQGDGMSMLDIGERYYYGRGTRPNLIRAVTWYQLAGDHGEAIGYQMAENAGLRLNERDMAQVTNQVRSIKMRMQKERDQVEAAKVTARREQLLQNSGKQ